MVEQKSSVKHPLLRTIWEKEKAPCPTAYSKINKVNYHLCEDKCIMLEELNVNDLHFPHFCTNHRNDLKGIYQVDKK